MGIEYKVNVSFGYVFRPEEIHDMYFSAGKYRLPGGVEEESCEDLETFLEEILAPYLRCDVHVESNAWTGETGKVVFSPFLSSPQYREVETRLTISGGQAFATYVNAMPEAERLHQRLRDVGLVPGPLLVVPVVRVF